jgi:putative Mn2+ efflux pump MntP
MLLFGGMGLELVLIAVGLSMDAFAVSLCKGLCMKRIRYGQAAVTALFFGVFQALMPLAGWALGKQFESYVKPVDHWVAFALLSYIGGKMIWEALRSARQDTCKPEGKIDFKELLILSVATSIDALAVGISFAFLQTAIVPAVAEIGAITFALSFIGVLIGHRFGTHFRRGAEIAGGAVLILIGLKILLEHLGVLGGFII